MYRQGNERGKRHMEIRLVHPSVFRMDRLEQRSDDAKPQPEPATPFGLSNGQFAATMPVGLATGIGGVLLGEAFHHPKDSLRLGSLGLGIAGTIAGFAGTAALLKAVD